MAAAQKVYVIRAKKGHVDIPCTKAQFESIRDQGKLKDFDVISQPKELSKTAKEIDAVSKEKVEAHADTFEVTDKPESKPKPIKNEDPPKKRTKKSNK